MTEKEIIVEDACVLFRQDAETPEPIVEPTEPTEKPKKAKRSQAKEPVTAK